MPTNTFAGSAVRLDFRFNFNEHLRESVMDPVLYDVWDGRARRSVAQTNDPQTVAFYAGVGYTVRIAS